MQATINSNEPDALAPRVARTGGFGHEVVLAVPASILVVFVASTIAIATLTNDIVAAAGFGAYLSFWLGGGFGFLIAGIRWGLVEEAADHPHVDTGRP